MNVTSKPRAEYQTPEYDSSGLPRAPAIMLGGKVLAESREVSEEELEEEIRNTLHPMPGLQSH